MSSDKIILEADFAAARVQDGDQTLNDLLDDVYDHLSDKLGVQGVSLVSDPEDGTFVVSMVVEREGDESGDEAGVRGMTQIRTALHASGCGTPDWLRSTTTPVSAAPTKREDELVH